MPDLFKEIIPSVMMNKRNVLVSEDDEKSYVPFIVNKALSFHLDCILFANEMNMNHHIDGKMQYDFFLNSLRGYKRPFQPWYKRETMENLEILKEYYGFSNDKAKEALRILNDGQLDKIRKMLDKGGSYESRRPSMGKASRSASVPKN